MQNNSNKKQQNDNDSALTDFEQLNIKINEHNEWILKCEELLSKNPSEVNELDYERLIFEISECENDLSSHQTKFEDDYKMWSSKLKCSSEIDVANQYYTSILNQYSKVIKIV